MSDVASRDLCAELYELSGWKDCYFKWNYNDAVPEQGWYLDDENLAYPEEHTRPAYNLGYLLRKLPRHLTIKRKIYHLCIINGNEQDDNWIVDYVTTGRECWLHEGGEAQLTEDASVENAMVKLAIELFKKGILTRKGEV